MPDMVASALLTVNKNPLLREVNKSEYMSKLKNGRNKFLKISLLLADPLMSKV